MNKTFKIFLIPLLLICLSSILILPISAEDENEILDERLMLKIEVEDNSIDAYINSVIIQNEDIERFGDNEQIIDRIVIYDPEIGIIPETAQMFFLTTELSPKIAKSSGYYSCFKKVEWINRNGLWSLSLTPRFEAGGYSKDQAWSFLKSMHISDWQWNYRNVNSMYNQFVCHYDFAGTFKTPWNIEPSTSDKGYWGFVIDKCN